MDCQNQKRRITLLLLAWCCRVWAWPPTIGPEITFVGEHGKKSWENRGLTRQTNPKWQNPTEKGEWQDSNRLKDEILRGCPDCKLETESGKFKLPEFKITYPNGYWIVISVDPATTEIQTKPLPLEEYEKLAPYIQKNLYEPAARAGLVPKETDNHLNIGVRSAFPHVKNLAAFMVDQFNHPELALGVLGKDLHNGPPLAVQTKEQWEALQHLLDSMGNYERVTFMDFARALNRQVYYRSRDWKDPASGKHYQAVSIKRLEKFNFEYEDAPVELRYAAGKVTLADSLKLYQLMIKRIQYLNERQESKIIVRDRFLFSENMTHSELLSRFALFLNEMGEKLEDHRNLIANKAIANAKLDSFLGPRDWKDRKTIWEITSYLPDLDISSWARSRFKEILNDSSTPKESQVELLNHFRKHLVRKALPAENKEILSEYAKSILPLGEEIRWAPGKAGASGGKCHNLLQKIWPY
jgi:hypothetical protein